MTQSPSEPDPKKPPKDPDPVDPNPTEEDTQQARPYDESHRGSGK